MPTQKGDKYNSKWNESYSLEQVKKWHEYAKGDTQCYYFGTVLAHFELWDDLARRLETKFEDTEISRTIKKIKELLRKRLVQAGLDEKVSVSMAIFILKNMGLSDKKDINVQVEPITFEIILANKKK